MALAISRNVGESLFLTLPDLKEVEVYIHKVCGHKVKLAITAPPEIAITRDCPRGRCADCGKRRGDEERGQRICELCSAYVSSKGTCTQVNPGE